MNYLNKTYLNFLLTDFLFVVLIEIGGGGGDGGVGVDGGVGESYLVYYYYNY